MEYEEYIQTAIENNSVENILEKLKYNIADMDAHTYHSHAEEWPLDFEKANSLTVGDIYFLYHYLGGEI